MYEEHDEYATPGDAMREYARNVGHEDRHVESAWILTDYDVWVENPHYRGPAQPHPEDAIAMEEDFERAIVWADGELKTRYPHLDPNSNEAGALRDELIAQYGSEGVTT